MVPGALISFREAEAPIRERVTKFGGQPVWLGEPTWPLSRQTGRPMRFLAQVALDPRLLGAVPTRMAYLFMTDEEEFVDGTYEPEGGENAVVLQPGVHAGPAQAIAEGPTLYRMVERAGTESLVAEPCEYAALLASGGDEGQEDFPNKVGGEPDFLQGEEYPGGGPWRLLMQLDSGTVPFHLNFGDAGVGYAFVSKDGTTGRFLWQCS